MAKGIAIRRPLNRRTILCTFLMCTAASSATTPWANAAADNSSKSKQADENKMPAAKPADATADFADARLIRIRLPLAGNADTHAKNAIQRVFDQLTRQPRRDNRRPTLILELTPQRRNAGSGEGTDFTRALSLANALTQPDMSAVKTVAYIPQTIKGHGVLIAPACEEIVMAPNAEFGEAGIDENP